MSICAYICQRWRHKHGDNCTMSVFLAVDARIIPKNNSIYFQIFLDFFAQEKQISFICSSHCLSFIRNNNFYLISRKGSTQFSCSQLASSFKNPVASAHFFLALVTYLWQVLALKYKFEFFKINILLFLQLLSLSFSLLSVKDCLKV